MWLQESGGSHLTSQVVYPHLLELVTKGHNGVIKMDYLKGEFHTH